MAEIGTEAQAWAPSPSGELLTAVVDGVAHARLHRPRAINALSAALVADLRAALSSWCEDDGVVRIVLDGAGERGFCAGADVRAVRELVLAGDLDAADAFFRGEYALCTLVAQAPTPITVLQRGIVMGGGLGLSAAASDRVIDAGAVLAMPETQIGFAPDAGVPWFLGRGGEAGLHLALTGATMNAGDALALGLADRCDGGAPAPSVVGADWLDCYRAGDPVAIVAALESHGGDAAREAAATIRGRSPLMVWVAWESWRAARGRTWDEVLAADLVCAHATVRGSDFAEGVRAQLVDKDRAPRWTHARLEDVTPADVAPYLPA